MPPIPRSRSFRLTLLALLFGVAGLAQAIGGAWLAVIGGSWYYLMAGILLGAVALLLLGRRPAALPLYAASLVGTLAWALWEVGLNVWLLMPRLLVPLAFGVLIGLPAVRRRLGNVPRRAEAGAAAPDAPRAGPRVALASVWGAVLLTVLAGGIAAVQDHATHGTWQGREDPAAAAEAAIPDADWHFYGRTPRGDRFSPLADITPQNVSRLQPAWVARTGDTMREGENKGGTDAGHEFNFEVTPLKVGDTLYLCTPHSWVVALDARTGQQKWKFDPHANTEADVYLACRGVAY